jgi:hypothetical protein
MIVNDPVPLLNNSIEFGKNKILHRIFNFSKKDYWLVDVLFFTKELLIEVIPKHIRNDIRTGKITLAIANNLEGFTSIVDTIYLVAIELNLPEENIILFTGNKSILSTVNEVATRYNRKDIKCIWVRYSEYVVRIQSILAKFPEKYVSTVFSKKFLNFNRRWRPHRPTFVGLLLSRRLIDSGYISLSEFEGFNWDNIWDEILRLNNDSEIKNILQLNEEAIKSIPNLHIDKKVLDDTCISIESNVSKYYSETYFSIVSETYFYESPELENGIFLSEKTFKPMVYKHPFIIIGPPYLIKTLQELGYRTFSPFINESYDNETNHSKRLLMILDEVERLCKLEGDKLIEFIEGCEAICEHNRNHLFTGVRINELYQELN